MHPDSVALVKWLMPGRWEILSEGSGDEWVTVRVMMDSPVLAKMMMFGLGRFGKVIDPPELAQMLLADARDLVESLTDHVKWPDINIDTNG